jgi:hypothetical protein
MQRVKLTSLVALALVGAACNEPGGSTPVGATIIEVPILANAVPAEVGLHQAHAVGASEVPANDSRGQGQATFRLSADGTELHYTLHVANIENVTQSHIHLAPAGTNGGIVAWLYPSAPPSVLIPGRSQGVLAEGTIRAANLVGPLAGSSLEALMTAMIEGRTYVNVHTSQFPPGEIRGQIK